MPTLLTWPARKRRDSRGPHERFHGKTMLKCLKVIASEQLTEGRIEQHVQAASVFKASHHRQDGIRNCDCH